MFGRTVFMDSLVAHGIDRIFGNPGTTESPLIDALADYPSIEYTVALHEGVALGAASFYAAAARTTGIVNLHVAPGLGNGIGMLYNAMKANAPMIVTAGQQDTRLRLRNPVLGHDLVAMAAPCVKWSVQAESADEMADLMYRAFKVANDPPFGPVFIALPINVMEQETKIGAHRVGRLHKQSAPTVEGIGAMAALLAEAKEPVIVAGDDVAKSDATAELIRLAERLGAPVWSEGIRGQASFPGGHDNAKPQLPVDAAAIARSLGSADVVCLIGGPFFEEVWFAQGSAFPPGAAVVQLESSPQRLSHNYPVDVGVVGNLKDGLTSLDGALMAAMAQDAKLHANKRNAHLAASKAEERTNYVSRLERAAARRPMAMSVAMDTLARALPDDVVIVDESITAGLDLARSFEFNEPNRYFSGRGGGIGQGLPGAVGVQLAMPSKTVACISGDGSAMYSIQALWTAARYELPIVFIILSNGEYRILKHNLDSYRQRFTTGSNRPYAHMDLGEPALGFIEMAAGMGLTGARASTPKELEAAIQNAVATAGPSLIEVTIEGKR
jgi:benzoylformate decarboxylase